jgi:hypothetical protein
MDNRGGWHLERKDPVRGWQDFHWRIYKSWAWPCPYGYRGARLRKPSLSALSVNFTTRHCRLVMSSAPDCDIALMDQLFNMLLMASERQVVSA